MAKKPFLMRNPELSWEEHAALTHEPDRYDLIQDTDRARQALRERPIPRRTLDDLLAEHRPELGDQATEIIRRMEADGLIRAGEGDKVIVSGTRDELKKYGMDPMLFESPITASTTMQMDTAHARPDVLDPENLVMVHSRTGGRPLLFPREILERAEASGEVFERFTREEMEEWRAENGSQAAVDMVTGFEPDGAEARISFEIHANVDKQDFVNANTTTTRKNRTRIESGGAL